MKNKVEAAHTILEVHRDDWSFQVYKEMKKRYKCEINAQIKRENLVLIESSTNRNSTIWRVINENIKGSNSGRETTPLDATMMNQYFATIGSPLDNGVDRSEGAVGGIRIMSIEYYYDVSPRNYSGRGDERGCRNEK
ncbi:hypothetical protein HHI36_017720 [Cryptolaemus montrouzieri]|uniref:Uncharacterized protein n=1 Tax=Cryptolaemus montrouzieri TaxID=559131 RepID=A0ABD2NNR2_9CUCU